MADTEPRWIRAGRGDFDRVVEALCDAFHDYPVMRYVLKDAGDDYDELLRDLVGYFTIKRVVNGWPVLGLERGGRLLAAANVDPATRPPAPPELKAHRARFAERIGPDALRRFQLFADVCEPLEPKEPHYYLGMVGVRAEVQGQGLGARLVREVQSMSRADPASAGVVLTTETPDNLPFYQRLGFEVLGEADAEDLHSWTLFSRD